MSQQNIELILSDPASKFSELIGGAQKEIVILSPWLKSEMVKFFLERVQKDIKVEVYTRVNIIDFIKGVSDIEALRLIFKKFKDIRISCIPNLHAKIYIIDQSVAFITSSNLTSGGFRHNIEGGVIIRDDKLVSSFTQDISELLKDSYQISSSDFESVISSIPFEEIKKEIKEKTKKDYSIENLVLGRKIFINKEKDAKLKEISSKTSIDLDILEGAEENEVKWKSGELGEEILKKILNYVRFSQKLDVELLEQAFLHPTYINLYKIPVHTKFFRLVDIGKFALRASTYLNAVNSSKVGISAEILGRISMNSLYLNNDAFLQKYKLNELVKVGSDDLLKQRKTIDDVKLSFIGTVFLSVGFEEFKRFLLEEMPISFTKLIESSYLEIDPKTTIQEISQKKFSSQPKYEITGESGDDHSKSFTCSVYVGGSVFGKGEGPSKKKAEVSAAIDALGSSEFQEYVNKFIYSKKSSEKDNNLIFFEISNQRKEILQEALQKFGISDQYLYHLNKALTHPMWLNDRRLNSAYSNTIYSAYGSQLFELYVYKKLFYKSEILDSELAPAFSQISKLREKLFNKLRLSSLVNISSINSETDSFKTDVVLSLLYVLYLNEDFAGVTQFLDMYLGEEIEEIINKHRLFVSFKSRLQEIAQSNGENNLLEYSLINSEGASHDSKFYIDLLLYGKMKYTGVGKSIQEAEESAAKQALKDILDN